MRFGSLTAEKWIERTSTGDDVWSCRCDCGRVVRALASSLRARADAACTECRPGFPVIAKRRARGQPRKCKPVGKPPASIGDRRVDQHGYTVVNVGPGLWAPEHRLRMEEKLGRKLEPGESVRHMNGIRSDNRLDNLELRTEAVPHGQRTSDLVEWAEAFLRKHAPHKLPQGQRKGRESKVKNGYSERF